MRVSVGCNPISYVGYLRQNYALFRYVFHSCINLNKHSVQRPLGVGGVIAPFSCEVCCIGLFLPLVSDFPYCRIVWRQQGWGCRVWSGARLLSLQIYVSVCLRPPRWGCALSKSVPCFPSRVLFVLTSFDFNDYFNDFKGYNAENQNS